MLNPWDSNVGCNQLGVWGFPKEGGRYCSTVKSGIEIPGCSGRTGVGREERFNCRLEDMLGCRIETNRIGIGRREQVAQNTLSKRVSLCSDPGLNWVCECC